MGSDDWPAKPYEAPTTWGREGNTFMSKTMIENILRNAEVGIDWWDLMTHKLAWLSPLKDARGERLYAVQGGIGAFTEDCRILFSTLALAESGVLESKT